MRCPLVWKCAKLHKAKLFLIRQHFHTTDGLCDLQRPRRSFCLPCASPLLFKRGNMFSLFVSSSGSPRMGEMMRSTGGAEDEGGQAATETTLADSEMRVKLFCIHKYVTQLPLFLYIFIIWLGCAHTDHFMRWITRQSCGSESVHLGMSWSNSEPALNRSLTELRLFVFPPQTWCFSAPLHCWAGVKHRFGSTYVRSWELGYYRYKFLSCLKQLT